MKTLKRYWFWFDVDGFGMRESLAAPNLKDLPPAQRRELPLPHGYKRCEMPCLNDTSEVYTLLARSPEEALTLFNQIREFEQKPR